MLSKKLLILTSLVIGGVAFADERPNNHASLSSLTGERCNSPSSINVVVKNVAPDLKPISVWMCLEKSGGGWEDFYLTGIAYDDTNNGAFVCSGTGRYILKVCDGDGSPCSKPCP